MELSPRLYNWFVRPEWFSRLYIHNILKDRFDFENKTVLDFGCGTGTSCSMFASHHYIGVDCDPKRIRYAQNHYPDYTFRLLNGHNLSLPENIIDYILVISVLHHIPTEEIALYLKEFQRILKPCGKILVIEPCFFEKSHISNLFMRFFDRGKYIQSETEYLRQFKSYHYTVEVFSRKKQLCFYNKLFFLAVRKTYIK